jgi:hypothetical protein
VSQAPALPAAAVPPPPDPVEAVAALVRSCPGVASLSAGMFGEVATYLPGMRRVRGIRFDEERVEVHIVAVWGPALPDLARQVRAVCAAFAGTRLVDVFVDDLQLPQPPTSQG